MRYVLTAEEMRALDAATINGIGIPGAVLMENAGRALSDYILALLSSEDASSNPGAAQVAVICGAGNNGGDGYVAARWLREAGMAATVYLAAVEAGVSGDAAVHLGAYRRCGGAVVPIADGAGLADASDAIVSAEIIVDCVFGTGLDRSVGGHYRAVIETLNGGRGQIVACDIPSGLAADTGEVLGIAARAQHTVTMGFLKRGLVVGAGVERVGRLSVAAIGIPNARAQALGANVAWLERGDLSGELPEISVGDHKNRRGHVLVVGGSPGKLGAGRLCAWSALRIGAGLVTLGAAEYDPGAPDPVMSARVADPGALITLAEGKRAVAIGPGMELGDDGARLVHAALDELRAALVLDADALNHLGTDLARVLGSQAPVVLTPHPGEAARLLGREVSEVEADRVGSVRELAARAGAVVVLKGAHTLVCDGVAGDGFVTVNPTGNAGLATAGSGDVLTGVIAGLIAQGTAPCQAARLGVWLHGAAADLAIVDLGMRSLTSSDLADTLPAALAGLVLA